MSGRWGEGLVSLFKKGVSLATREEHSWQVCDTMEAPAEYHCTESLDEASSTCNENVP